MCSTEVDSYLLPAQGDDGPIWLPPHLQTAARIAANECASTSLRSVDCKQGRKSRKKNTRKSKGVQEQLRSAVETITDPVRSTVAKNPTMLQLATPLQSRTEGRICNSRGDGDERRSGPRGKRILGRQKRKGIT